MDSKVDYIPALKQSEKLSYSPSRNYNSPSKNQSLQHQAVKLPEVKSGKNINESPLKASKLS